MELKCVSRTGDIDFQHCQSLFIDIFEIIQDTPFHLVCICSRRGYDWKMRSLKQPPRQLKSDSSACRTD